VVIHQVACHMPRDRGELVTQGFDLPDADLTELVLR